jgi:hypothetical protein
LRRVELRADPAGGLGGRTGLASAPGLEVSDKPAPSAPVVEKLGINLLRR